VKLEAAEGTDDDALDLEIPGDLQTGIYFLKYNNRVIKKMAITR
jgi:hypothetical protein